MAGFTICQGESVEILGAYHEQAYFQEDEISVNQKSHLPSIADLVFP